MKPINPNSWFKSRSSRTWTKSSFSMPWLPRNWDKKTIIKRGGAFTAFFVLVVWFLLYANIYRGLPDVSTIKDMVFAQATVITDRNGKELYKLFEQNRQYVPYESISETMINAIIAMEDQRYWDHSGLDAIGILRAWIKTLGGSTQGASTIPQQLVMNLLLYRGRTFSEKVTRKLKEMVLTRRLDSTLESQIRKENRWLSNAELRRKMKETTLELYLNYIFLGNNAYWIEAASNTYFGTSANNLGVLESAIIASIPKWPSIYEPYRNRSRLMGQIRISDPQGNVIEVSTGMQAEAYARVVSAIDTMRIGSNANSSDVLRSLQNATSFTLSYGWRNFSVQYVSGRKDLALTRMLEDGYISDLELKKALIDGLDYTFQSSAFAINAPHFVHWITELLEKEYDKELLQWWWLVVKTSLDREIQQQIEKIFRDTQWELSSHGANNKAMIYLDSSNGDVIAYVGSTDYFNETIEGKNDIVRRRRQIGSSIKPFIYALWFQELPINLDTPIFDIPFDVGWDEPSNADGEFLWLLPLRQALAFSRNIPAVKMFLAAGGEAIIKPWLQKAWLTSLSNNIEYGYPLSLGAWEVTMLELADAYVQLSRQGERVIINPILEIRSSNGSLLYEKEVVTEQSVISPGAASLIREILSNTANMPSNWVNMFSVRGLRLAAKSGTSDVKTPNGTRPRDGWLATYTPSRVAIFWVGNTDGAPMNRNAFGWTILWSNMRSFYGWLFSNNFIANESLTPVETIEMQVSKLTGLPASDNTPSEFIVTTRGPTNNQPSIRDMWATPFEFDTMCNGLTSPYTPLEDIRNGYIIQPYSFMPNNMDLAEITNRWTRSTQVDTGWIESIPQSQRGRILATKYNFNNIFVFTPTEPCADRIPKEDQRIAVEIVLPKAAGNIARTSSVTYNINSPKMIREVTILVNDEVVGRNRYNPARTTIVDATTITIPSTVPAWDIVIKVVAADIVWFSNSASQTMKLINQDNNPPRVESQRVITQADGTYEVRLFIVDDESYVTSGTIKKNGTTVHAITNSIVSFKTSTLGEFVIQAVDFYGNTSDQTITLSAE
jgi:penicillin-binding protein 1A